MKKFALIISDLAALYGTLALVLLIRYGQSGWHLQYAMHVVPFTILFAVWLLSFYIANLYDERALRNDRFFFSRFVQALIIGAGLSTAFFYLIPYFGITPKTNLILFIAIFAALQTGIRYLFNTIIAGGAKKRILIVGMDSESLDLARFITDNPQLGYTVRGLARLGQESLVIDHQLQWPVIEHYADIEQFIVSDRIETVVLGPQTYRSEELVNIFYRTLPYRVNFISLATFSEQVTGTVPLGAISQSWFLDNMTEGSKKSYELGKRVMDIVASIALGLPTALITPIVALAIKASSPGPVFFRQKRTGRGGIPFEIIKFRTMRQDAEKSTGAVWAQENDPRVTALGRFLRKTRIDELPQLWNILTGQMSFVGPRAERPEFDEQLAQHIPFYHERYLIKPGLSGWAQINYPYGASVQDAVRKLEHDLYYIKHRSFMLDLEIILKTITISLQHAGR
jgi:exopolysaccharide biosynthesis polyprenyl glycosylphosphotransferase